MTVACHAQAQAVKLKALVDEAGNVMPCGARRVLAARNTGSVHRAPRVHALVRRGAGIEAALAADSLAEALGAPLYTCDRKLTGAGHAAEVRLISSSR